MTTVFEPSSADVPRLRDFLLRAWREAGPGTLGWTGATEDNIQEIASEPFLSSLLTHPSTKVLVAVDIGEVIGIAVLRDLDAPAAELAGMIVLESQTGRGAGSLLLEEALRQCRAFRTQELVVKTEGFNDRALQFYQQHGFRVVERRSETAAGTTVDLVILRRVM